MSRGLLLAALLLWAPPVAADADLQGRLQQFQDPVWRPLSGTAHGFDVQGDGRLDFGLIVLVRERPLRFAVVVFAWGDPLDPTIGPPVAYWVTGPTGELLEFGGAPRWWSPSPDLGT